MKKHLAVGTLTGVLTMCFAGLALAVEGVSSTKDLTAVIALQGLPCGQVVSAIRQGENDYTATCQDGNRYRVFLNAAGRVVVQRL